VGSIRGASLIGGIVIVVPSVPARRTSPTDHGLRVGLCQRVELDVGYEDTAEVLRSGDVPVLATPRLVALCEEASCRALDGHLSDDRTSVATRVQFDHRAPVGIGARVTAEAKLVRVEGRRLIFNVSASLRSDTWADVIGAGRLTRVVVDRAAFLAKARAQSPA
jgi:predicted thioesterase